MHVVALAFAPASVLAPMNSIGLIANAVTAAVSAGDRGPQFLGTLHNQQLSSGYIHCADFSNNPAGRRGLPLKQSVSRVFTPQA